MPANCGAANPGCSRLLAGLVYTRIPAIGGHLGILPDRAATARSCEKMWFTGETACATNGESFACIGGAGAFACQFRFRANISHLASEGALADSVAGVRSGPRGYPGRGSDWGCTAARFYVARTPACAAPGSARRRWGLDRQGNAGLAGTVADLQQQGHGVARLAGGRNLHVHLNHSLNDAWSTARVLDPGG